MPAPVLVECEAVDNVLHKETGRLIPDAAYRLGYYTSFWLYGVKQCAWPDHMGTIISQLISQRTIPATIRDWQNVGSSGDGNNACLPPVEILPYAAKSEQMQLAAVAVESDPICLEDIRAAAVPGDELNNRVDGFAGYINTKWIKRYRDEYLRLSKHKVVVSQGLPEDEDAFPAVQPTSQLTLGVLKTLRERMLRDNAGATAMATAGTGQPVFTVLTSSEQKDNIVKLHSKIKEEFLWNSNRTPDLFKPMGEQFAYQGLNLVPEAFTPRYNWDGDGYVEVPEYIVNEDGAAEVNPAYETAEFEVTFIYHPQVMQSMVPGPSVSTPAKISFPAQNYRGEARWVNEYDRHCNPDKKIGFLRAVLTNASRPLHTRWGYAIMHLRCDVAFNFLGCSQSPSPSPSPSPAE